MHELKKKLNDEIKANEKNPNIKKVGEYLISLLPKLDDDSQQAMMDETKTIKGSIEAMRTEARKVAVSGVGMFSDEEGFKIVRDYFGIDGKTFSNDCIVNLNDYL